MTQTTEMDGRRCPHCWEPSERATGRGADPPEPGDISICVYCLEISRFRENLLLRRLTPAEMKELMASPAWREIQRLRLGLELAKTEGALAPDADGGEHG